MGGDNAKTSLKVIFMRVHKKGCISSSKYANKVLSTIKFGWTGVAQLV